MNERAWRCGWNLRRGRSNRNDLSAILMYKIIKQHFRKRNHMLGFLKANLLKSLTGHSLFQGRLSKGYFALLFIWSAFLWYLFGVRAWHCFPGPFLNTMPSKAFSLASESFHIIRKLWGLYLTNGSFRCQCLPPRSFDKQ